jgi:hypothetical protein
MSKALGLFPSDTSALNGFDDIVGMPDGRMGSDVDVS